MKELKYLLPVFFVLIVVIFFTGCGQKKQLVINGDTPTNGSINISVDESFEPVIKEQIEMYEATYPGTKINALYKTESECIKDFFKDSTIRLIIITRGITAKEDKFLTDSLSFRPGWNQIATDAIAVVVNKNSNDTTFSLASLQQQLTGQLKNNKTVVFDGLKQTSTARFIIDSVLKGKPFDTTIVRAVQNSNEVLNYVATHINAIGFVGNNRIGNPEDTTQVAMLRKVKIGYVKCDVCVNTPYIFPSQESIMNRRYPLVRGLYYNIKENYTGLGSGFVAFLKYERGQLIFRRAYLGPVMDFRLRNVNLNENLPKD